MREIERRFPGTRSIARIAIASLPTPVEQLAVATKARVYCKRDDLTSPRYGGNKVRKLEYLLADARRTGAETIVTMGALGSHHVLATSIFGSAEGFDVHAVLIPQPYTIHVEENLRADVAAGATLHRAPNAILAATSMYAIASRLRLRGKKPYVIGPGGSSPIGALGYVEAGLELAAQVDRGELPEPTAVFLSLGSGGTAAGLALGLAAAGIQARIVAVRATEKYMFHRAMLEVLLRRAQSILRAAEPRFPDVASIALRNVVIDEGELGRGYGHATQASARALNVARERGLELDGTYTSKAFAALLRDADQQGSLLFLNTLSSANVNDLLEAQPRAPHWARAFAGRAG